MNKKDAKKEKKIKPGKKNQKENGKKRDIKKIVRLVVYLSFVLPLGFIVYKLFTAPMTNETNEIGVKVKSDYFLMFMQCMLGILAIIIPEKITKKVKLEVPDRMYIVYLIFLYCSIFLGEVKNFYYLVPHWDTILHTFSGAMLGALGFSFINLLNKRENDVVKLSPFFVAFFSFCFAITLGVVWEIYEFLCDGLFFSNMQKFAFENGVQKIGRAALFDTMKDLLVDSIGGFITSVVGYISIKNKKQWFEDMLIKRKE